MSYSEWSEAGLDEAGRGELRNEKGGESMGGDQKVGRGGGEPERSALNMAGDLALRALQLSIKTEDKACGCDYRRH